MSEKYVYHFEEAYGLGKELLGGKGAGLAEMTHIGVSIPQGFTITTEACTLYYENEKKLPSFLIEDIKKGIKEVERKTKKHFGGNRNPLLVSVRSGALIRQFMPDEIFMNRKKVRDAEAIIKSLEIDENDRAGVMLPISYVYGLSVVNSHLLADAELLLPQGNMFQREYWDFLEEHRVTSFCGVPYTYEILDCLRILSRPWKELRLLTQAGGAMSCEMKQKLLEWIYDRRQRGIKTHLAIMYGQTEATARMSTFFLDQHPEKMDSVGRAIPVVCVSKALDEQILLFIRTKDFRNIDIMELTDYLRQLGIRREQYQI